MAEKKLRDKDGRQRILFKRVDKARKWLNAVLAKSPMQNLEANGWSTVQGSHLICGIHAFKVELFRLQWDTWLHSQRSSLAPMTTAWQAFAATQDAKRPATDDDQTTAISWATKALGEEVKGLTTLLPVLHCPGWKKHDEIQMRYIPRSIRANTEWKSNKLNIALLKPLEDVDPQGQEPQLALILDANLVKTHEATKDVELVDGRLLSQASIAAMKWDLLHTDGLLLGVRMDTHGAQQAAVGTALCQAAVKSALLTRSSWRRESAWTNSEAAASIRYRWEDHCRKVGPYQNTGKKLTKDQQNQQAIQDENILEYLEGLTVGILPGLYKEHRTVTREAGLLSLGYRGLRPASQSVWAPSGNKVAQRAVLMHVPICVRNKSNSPDAASASKLANDDHDKLRLGAVLQLRRAKGNRLPCLLHPPS
ncbi:hypothetical protein IE81DRAFT_349490 [Ceraceosorus guamensis]|uniref:Uncharacterized protein n=1 Tax=Ceraceosorus guamensis TaxID=1522189 RepID=A0A316VRE7_9BASI|nr:hypothetical protein IE81DRAFT_349490 [Ceraceosorus guamensis]PWN40166.1 hypothetical protein IE81DRAFT_349490 [Ceraceosorus guamensis]